MEEEIDNGANVRILHTWSDFDHETSEMAFFVLSFRLFEPRDLGYQECADRREIREAVEAELQSIATKRFPNLPVSVDVTRIKQGSLDIYFALLTVGGPVFAFFKYYPDFRKGVEMFAQDVKKASGKIAQVVKRTYKVLSSRGPKNK